MLKTAVVSLKLKKCSFAADEAEYLGFRVGRGGLSLNPKKISAVKEAKLPTNKC